MKIQRFDRSTILKAEKTAAGFLRVPIRATRVGVFKYIKKDGSTRRELRLPEEVFNPDSMNSLAGIPITIEHPDKLVDSKNSRRHMVGFSGEDVHKEEDFFLSVSGTITQEDAITDIEFGKQEVSCGYEMDLEESPGVYEGERYDFIQRNIRYNHIAVVDKGRAGTEVRLRLDQDDAVMVDNKKTKEELEVMPKIKLNGKEFDVSKDVAEAFGAEKKSMDAKFELFKKKGEKEDSLQAELDTATAKADSLSKENEGLKEEAAARKDSDPSKEELAKEEVKKAARRRIDILKVAEKVLPAETKFDDMSDLDLQKAVIKADDKEVNLDEKSDVYIEARFDHVNSTSKKRTDKNDDLGKTIAGNREDDADVVEKSEKARADSIAKSKEAWKKPVGVSLDSVKN